MIKRVSPGLPRLLGLVFPPVSLDLIILAFSKSQAHRWAHWDALCYPSARIYYNHVNKPDFTWFPCSTFAAHYLAPWWWVISTNSFLPDGHKLFFCCTLSLREVLSSDKNNQYQGWGDRWISGTWHSSHTKQDIHSWIKEVTLHWSCWYIHDIFYIINYISLFNFCVYGVCMCVHVHAFLCEYMSIYAMVQAYGGQRINSSFVIFPHWLTQGVAGL